MDISHNKLHSLPVQRVLATRRITISLRNGGSPQTTRTRSFFQNELIFVLVDFKSTGISYFV